MRSEASATEASDQCRERTCPVEHILAVTQAGSSRAAKSSGCEETPGV